MQVIIWSTEGEEAHLNLYDNDWDVERTHGDANVRMMHVGRRLGSELLGATVFEFDPGMPYISHFHHGNEEWALVLNGPSPSARRTASASCVRATWRSSAAGRREHTHSPTIRIPCAVWPSSPACVHPDIVDYPDAGVLGAIAGDAPTAGRDAPFEAFFRRQPPTATTQRRIGR